MSPRAVGERQDTHPEDSSSGRFFWSAIVLIVWNLHRHQLAQQIHLSQRSCRAAPWDRSAHAIGKNKYWSVRLDLNQRPLRPEGLQAGMRDPRWDLGLEPNSRPRPEQQRAFRFVQMRSGAHTRPRNSGRPEVDEACSEPDADARPRCSRTACRQVLSEEKCARTLVSFAFRSASLSAVDTARMGPRATGPRNLPFASRGLPLSFPLPDSEQERQLNAQLPLGTAVGVLDVVEGLGLEVHGLVADAEDLSPASTDRHGPPIVGIRLPVSRDKG